MRGKDCRWRYTAATPMFLGIIDSRVLLPYLLLLFHFRPWVFWLASGTTLVFFALSLFRITPLEGLRGAWLWVVTLGFRRNVIGHRPYRRPMSWH